MRKEEIDRLVQFILDSLDDLQDLVLKNTPRVSQQSKDLIETAFDEVRQELLDFYDELKNRS